MNLSIRFFLSLLAVVYASAGFFVVPFAQVETPSLQVKDLWVRATVDGQKGTGGFMTLIAGEDLRLVGVQSPVAGLAELHEMTLDSATQVMRMRPIQSLLLPKGQAVVLKPGGHHFMLLDLKQTLVEGSTIPLSLVLKPARGGAEFRLHLQVPVRLKNADPTASSGEHGHAHGP